MQVLTLLSHVLQKGTSNNFILCDVQITHSPQHHGWVTSHLHLYNRMSSVMPHFLHPGGSYSQLWQL